jgi:NAD(P)-dependent dehydrogenase (short-subunit alcohol dehydrogenase family)
MSAQSSRVALITGGGRGLGRVMALALVRAGHRVVLSSTDLPSLQQVATETGHGEDRVALLTANLAVAGEAERLAEYAQRPFGQVDMVFNNAGMSVSALRTDALSRPYRFWEANRAIMEQFFAVNVIAGMVLAVKLAPAMMQRGWGRIVSNTTSLDTMLKQTLYGGTKAALEAETAVMARDLAGSGVTANVLVPGGGTGTRMTDQLGLPRDVLIHESVMAAPAVFLASRESDDFTARRILANRWQAALPPRDAALAASDPIAWTGIGTPGVQPAAAGKLL